MTPPPKAIQHADFRFALDVDDHSPSVLHRFLTPQDRIPPNYIVGASPLNRTGDDYAPYVAGPGPCSIHVSEHWGCRDDNFTCEDICVYQEAPAAIFFFIILLLMGE